MATYVDPYAPAAIGNNHPGSKTPGSSAVGSSTTSGTGTSDTTSSQSGTTNSNTQNMDSGSLQALQNLIAQLQSGGTSAMKQNKGQRDTEIGSLQQQREGYSKDAAFSDAQGLMAQTMRQALEKVLPGINSGSLGAGSSQSSMRALLTQKAAENAAEASSAQGLNAAVNYGNISTGLSGILERLIGQQDPATAALISALNVAKGATQNTTTASTQNGTSNTKTAQQQQQNTTETKTPLVGNATPNNGFGQFGAVDNKAPEAPNTIGTTEDTLRQLYGNQTFSNYTF